MPRSSKRVSPSEPTLPRPEPRRTREELRADTLAAAREIILSDGPEALTARRLAEAVGYTPGTIYNLFDGLPDVLWQVNRGNFKRIEELFEDLPGDDPTARLRNLAARYLRLVETEPTLFRALFDGPRRSDRFPDWYMQAIAGLLGRTADELRQLNPALTEAQARDEAAGIFAAVHGIGQLQVSARLDLLTNVSGAELADRLLSRILRDVATGA